MSFQGLEDKNIIQDLTEALDPRHQPSSQGSFPAPAGWIEEAEANKIKNQIEEALRVVFKDLTLTATRDGVDTITINSAKPKILTNEVKVSEIDSQGKTLDSFSALQSDLCISITLGEIEFLTQGSFLSKSAESVEDLGNVIQNVLSTLLIKLIECDYLERIDPRLAELVSYRTMYGDYRLTFIDSALSVFQLALNTFVYSKGEFTLDEIVRSKYFVEASAMMLQGVNVNLSLIHTWPSIGLIRTNGEILMSNELRSHILSLNAKSVGNHTCPVGSRYSNADRVHYSITNEEGNSPIQTLAIFLTDILLNKCKFDPKSLLVKSES